MRLSPRSLLSLFSNDLAIDLGTANSLVFCKGRGIVVSEPSIVAVNQKTGQGNIVAIRPMKRRRDRRLRAHREDARQLHQEGPQPLVRRPAADRHRRPSEITQVEKRAVRDSAMKAKATEVYLVEQSMMAAIGAGLPITEPTGNMVVDIGGGTTDVAVISMAGIVYARSVRVAGNEMDEAVTQYIKRKYNLLIGERTAEEIKIKIGSAFPLDEELTMEIKGRDLVEGVPKTITISDEEIRERWPRRSRRSSRPYASRWSRRRRSLPRTSSTAASCSPAAGAGQEPGQASARGDRPAGLDRRRSVDVGRDGNRQGPARLRPAAQGLPRLVRRFGRPACP